jgi:hypothetical protein
VFDADQPVEAHALDARYEEVRSEARNRGAEAVLSMLRAATRSAKAVIARDLGELRRLSTRDTELYATYYDLVETGAKIPPGEDWDVLRDLTDTHLFIGYKEEIRFAALSATGRGVTRYGKHFIILREQMIAHRTTVFEENSVMWMKHHDVKVWDAGNLPKGYRATWENREKLSCAKLGRRLMPYMTDADCAGLLLSNGLTGADDDFIEVHVYGSLSARSFERVIFSSPLDAEEEVLARDLRERFAKLGVEVEYI